MLDIAEEGWPIDEPTHVGPPCRSASLRAVGGRVTDGISEPHTVSGGGAVDVPRVCTSKLRWIRSCGRGTAALAGCDVGAAAAAGPPGRGRPGHRPLHARRATSSRLVGLACAVTGRSRDRERAGFLVGEASNWAPPTYTSLRCASFLSVTSKSMEASLRRLLITVDGRNLAYAWSPTRSADRARRATHAPGATRSTGEQKTKTQTGPLRHYPGQRRPRYARIAYGPKELRDTNHRPAYSDTSRIQAPGFLALYSLQRPRDGMHPTRAGACVAGFSDTR